MDQPLISVIVPVYKTERYLKECVDSLRAQTHRNLQIILVDDGSPDGSGALCDAFAREDSRILVIHKENGGLSDARNAGLDAMTGELVAFLDSDDSLEPETFEVLYRNLTEARAQIACCGIANYVNGTAVSCLNPATEERFVLDRTSALCQLAYNTKITNSACDKLYRAEIFDGLRFKKGILYEDLQIQAYCIARAERIAYSAQPLYRYRQSEGSILRGNFSPRHFDAYRAGQERLEFLKNHCPEALPYGKMAHLRVCLNLIYASRGREDWTEERRELLQYLHQPLEAEVKHLLSRKDKIKLALVKIHPALFCRVAELAERRTGL